MNRDTIREAVQAARDLVATCAITARDLTLQWLDSALAELDAQPNTGSPVPSPALPERERGTGTGIYVASKVKHAARWRLLRDEGVPVISTWIDEAGEGESGDYAELAARCIREATSARAVLLYCEPGDILKGALVEVGAALAMGVPVYCVGKCESLSRVFSQHPLWREFHSITGAVRASLQSRVPPRDAGLDAVERAFSPHLPEVDAGECECRKALLGLMGQVEAFARTYADRNTKGILLQIVRDIRRDLRPCKSDTVLLREAVEALRRLMSPGDQATNYQCAASLHAKLVAHLEGK
jgi:hypothetical protein